MAVSNGTSTCDGEKLCKIILKSIHNCTGYGTDKFGQTDALMQACTPKCHCDNYASLFTSGLDKMIMSHHLKFYTCLSVKVFEDNTMNVIQIIRRYLAVTE